MTTQSASAGGPPAEIVTRPASAISVKRPRSITERWLMAAFLLAGAAQLITIAALLGADPLATSWAALLLAIAPVLLAATAAFGPPSVSRLAAVAAAVAIIAGFAGSLADWSTSTAHTGVLFIPALVAVVVGGLRLWRPGPR
jgi:hypothetical protein